MEWAIDAIGWTIQKQLPEEITTTVKTTPQQIKTAVATNTRNRPRTQIDCTIPPAESDSLSCNSRRSGEHGQREVRKNESKIVRDTVKSTRECSTSQNMDLEWSWSRKEQCTRPRKVSELWLVSLRDKRVDHPLASRLQNSSFYCSHLQRTGFYYWSLTWVVIDTPTPASATAVLRTSSTNVSTLGTTLGL